jgi:cytochrome bd-type quinol oxidase subunit 2
VGAERRLPLGVLIGVGLWRALIVVFALVGFTSVPNGGGFGGGHGVSNFAYLTQQGSFLTAVVYAGLLSYPLFTRGHRHEPRTPWLRGALTVVMALISVTYMTMLGGSLSDTADQFEHLLTPIVVVLDWIVVGRAPSAARWWFPLTWLAFPLAYLAFYVSYVGDGTPLYPFLRPGHGNFQLVVFGFLVGVLGLGYLMYGIGKLKGALVAGAVENGAETGATGSSAAGGTVVRSG